MPAFPNLKLKPCNYPPAIQFVASPKICNLTFNIKFLRKIFIKFIFIPIRSLKFLLH